MNASGAAGPLHKPLTAMWYPLELIPVNLRYRDWLKRRAVWGCCLPLGEPRSIQPDSFVHTSAIERWKTVEEYRPVNLQQPYRVETMTGPMSGT